MTPLNSVLIVDDEPAVRELMARWVASLGLQPRTASNADEALASLNASHCDLAVIDLMMPGRNGLWLAGEVRRDHPNTAVVLATAYTALLDGLPQPVADLLIKPFPRERFVLAVDRGRDWRRRAIDDIEWHARLLREVEQQVEELRAALAAVRARGESEIELLRALTEARMADVIGHGERVARFSVAIGRALRLPEDGLSTIDAAARFHDIGKLATPEALLTKPSPLTPGEVAIMRKHVDAGAEILAATESLRTIAPLVRASHEWFGGGGYPQRLAGDAIPLASRIVAVADAYDAMTQDRRYRSRLDSADAIAELLRSAPVQFDPDIVVAFLNVLGQH